MIGRLLRYLFGGPQAPRFPAEPPTKPPRRSPDSGTSATPPMASITYYRGPTGRKKPVKRKRAN